MSLLQDVVALLDGNAIDHTLIGAAALAIHGVSRSTADIDLFTLDDRVLQEQLWSDLRGRGVDVRSLRGDYEDPLAGSVRLAMAGERTVDVVVGRYEWQKKIVESSEITSIGEVTVKVAGPAGLVLLKLYAGGPKDAWDIRSLLESHQSAASIEADVNAEVLRLPADSQNLWKRIREEH